MITKNPRLSLHYRHCQFKHHHLYYLVLHNTRQFTSPLQIISHHREAVNNGGTKVWITKREKEKMNENRSIRLRRVRCVGEGRVLKKEI